MHSVSTYSTLRRKPELLRAVASSCRQPLLSVWNGNTHSECPKSGLGILQPVTASEFPVLCWRRGHVEDEFGACVQVAVRHCAQTRNATVHRRILCPYFHGGTGHGNQHSSPGRRQANSSPAAGRLVCHGEGCSEQTAARSDAPSHLVPWVVGRHGEALLYFLMGAGDCSGARGREDSVSPQPNTSIGTRVHAHAPAF
ncbi:hypothetical protein RJ55_02841 [Drechmeria coniospora]|nr:hypothetical protein RJ55_02841 [Drechmeria coniospora]